LALLAALAIAAGCGPGAEGPARRPTTQDRDEFSVATYNLKHYSLEDRDGDGHRAEPKPEAERRAVVAVLSRCRPDVLALQEIGAAEVLEELRRGLRAVGLDYPHVAQCVRPGQAVGLAVLSRHPIVARRVLTNDQYRIGTTNLPVLRGFLDVEIEPRPSYRFRLLVAHLKSKVYHPLGQTEMRRNEARLLAQHAHQILRERSDANLLVVGDLNDSPDSAPLQRLLGEEERLLFDLRPADPLGDVWTHYSATVDVYSRIDYGLASAGMVAEYVRDKSCVVRDPATLVASDHRPLLLVFRASDAKPGPRP